MKTEEKKIEQELQMSVSSTNSFGVHSFFGSCTVVRQTGQLICSFPSNFSSIEVTYVKIQSSQKVCKHGRYFGFVYLSRQIGQFIRSIILCESAHSAILSNSNFAFSYDS